MHFKQLDSELAGFCNYIVSVRLFFFFACTLQSRPRIAICIARRCKFRLTSRSLLVYKGSVHWGGSPPPPPHPTSSPRLNIVQTENILGWLRLLRAQEKLQLTDNSWRKRREQNFQTLDFKLIIFLNIFFFFKFVTKQLQDREETDSMLFQLVVVPLASSLDCHELVASSRFLRGWVAQLFCQFATGLTSNPVREQPTGCNGKVLNVPTRSSDGLKVVWKSYCGKVFFRLLTFYNGKNFIEVFLNRNP